MREIKFRAWGKNLEQMLYPPMKIIGEMLDEELPENISFMQYTGLKDKNGKEIYELMEINSKYKVEYNFPKYILTNISNGDIVSFEEVIKNENELTITKEYTEI